MGLFGMIATVKSLIIINTVAQTTLAAVAVYDHMPLVKQATSAIGHVGKKALVGTGKLIGKGAVAVGKATLKATKYTYNKLAEKVEEKYDNWKYSSSQYYNDWD